MNFGWIVESWNWLRNNDVPNWVTLLFTAIGWPVVLFLWQKRPVNNVSGLEVQLSPGSIHINNQPHHAVAIDVINHTGAVVYITAARIKSCSSLFPVPITVSRDIAEGSHHLAFMDANNNFSQREITLQTNQAARTAIGVTSVLPQSFYSHRAAWYRRLVRNKRYFVLEYVAVVGRKRYAIRTLY